MKQRYLIGSWIFSPYSALQALSIDKSLNSISFDITGLSLYTEVGIINISALSDSYTLPTDLEPYNPKYQILALSSESVSITYNLEDLVWLLSEYQPSC